MFKICITDLDALKQRLRMEWVKLDHVVIAAAIRQWLLRWLQISDACFVFVLCKQQLLYCSLSVYILLLTVSYYLRIPIL